MNQRWKIISPDERNGIRNYVSAKIIELSSDPNILINQKAMVEKLNVVLIAVYIYY